MKTDAALKIIKQLATLEFRELDSNDRGYFADAGADAKISFAGNEMAEALCDATGQPIIDEEGNHLAVLIANDTIEIHGMTPDFEDVCLGLTLAQLI